MDSMKFPGEVWRGPVLVHLTDREAVVVLHDGIPVAGLLLNDGRCVNAHADEKAPIFAAWAMAERNAANGAIIAEREACAKGAESLAAAAERHAPADVEQAIGATYGAVALRKLAQLIRARSNP